MTFSNGKRNKKYIDERPKRRKNEGAPSIALPEDSSLTLSSERDDDVESRQSSDLSQQQARSKVLPAKSSDRHESRQHDGSQVSDQLHQTCSLVISPTLMAVPNQSFDPVIPESLTASGTSSIGAHDNKEGNDARQTNNGIDLANFCSHRPAENINWTHREASTSGEISLVDNEQYVAPTSPRERDSHLPRARAVLEGSVVLDRAEVEAQFIREILENVEEAHVVRTEAHDHTYTTSIGVEGSEQARGKLGPSRTLEQQESKYGHTLRYFLGCIAILFSTLVVTLAVTLGRCGTGLCLVDSQADMPLSSSSASPKTWTSIGENVFPYSDQVYSEIKNGMFGSRVSVSYDGRRILVAYGKNQELLELQNLASINVATAAELLDCNATECVKIADVARNVFGMKEGTLTAALSGDGSRIVVEYEDSFLGSSALVVYSVFPTATEEPIVVKEQEFDVPGNTSYRVALDSTGDAMVILAVELAGDAIVFSYDSTTAEYQPFGGPIPQKPDEHSKVLSLSSSGSVVAVGSDFSYGQFVCGTRVPLKNETVLEVISDIAVRVYEVGSDGEILQIGSDILSSRPGTFTTAEALALSEDGTIVAMAVSNLEYEECNTATEFRCCNPQQQGHVSVFRRSSSSDELSSWIAMGNPLSGVFGEHFGESISLSGDGQTLAVGAPSSRSNGLDSGRVLIYNYDNILDQWVQAGAELLGAVGSSFGHSVSLSKDGDTILVGSPLDQRKGALAGAATVFRSQGV